MKLFEDCALSFNTRMKVKFQLIMLIHSFIFFIHSFASDQWSKSIKANDRSIHTQHKKRQETHQEMR